MADIDLTARRDTCDGSRAPASTVDACAGPTGRLPLSCDRIVVAAVRYVDQDCLDGLSMRRLGAELGVEAMSLYRYFPSKAALLDAVVGRMLSDVVLPGADAGAGWEDAVQTYARSFRAVCAAHPRLLPLLATMGPTNPTLQGMERRMTDLWQAAGFDAQTAASVQTALQGYLTGSCIQGVGTPSGDAAFTLGLDALVAGLRGRLVGAVARA